MTLRYPPGSIGFCHGQGFLSRVIRFGERIRFRDGSIWNHVFIITDQVNATGEQLVIQAEGRGVTADKPLSSVASNGDYEVLDMSDSVVDVDVLCFAEGQVGERYGWLSIVSCAMRIILPRWLPMPRIRSKSTWICSALGAESLRCGGWIHMWDDIYTVVPAELYAAMKGLTLKDLPYRDFARTDS